MAIVPRALVGLVARVSATLEAAGDGLGLGLGGGRGVVDLVGVERGVGGFSSSLLPPVLVQLLEEAGHLLRPVASGVVEFWNRGR
jgi:hypothetical protein